MKRSNIVKNSLAVLTLAALGLPASAQFDGYRQGTQSPVRFQGGFNFPYVSWNNPPVFFGNNGGVYLPSSGEYYAPMENYYQPSDAEVNATRAVANGLPRTSDAIQVEKERTKVMFSWRGEPNAVRRITFALLDRSKQPIRQQVITQLPARSSLNRNGRTAYYQVTIEYLNGTTNSVIAPL